MKLTRKQLRKLIIETMTTPAYPLIKQMRDDDRIDSRIKPLLGSDDPQNVVMGANLVSTIHDDIKDYEDLDMSLTDPDTFSPEYEESFKKLSQNPLSDVVDKITEETEFTEDEIRKGVYLIDLVYKYPFNEPNDVYELLGTGVPRDIEDKGYIELLPSWYGQSYVVAAEDHERFLEAIDDHHENVIADKYSEATGIRMEEYSPPPLEVHYNFYSRQENLMRRSEGEYILVRPSRGLEDIM